MPALKGEAKGQIWGVDYCSTPPPAGPLNSFHLPRGCREGTSLPRIAVDSARLSDEVLSAKLSIIRLGNVRLPPACTVQASDMKTSRLCERTIPNMFRCHS